ncbi:hypothetical protein LTR16_001988 [Cryomyces antarcticus]|uniref:Mitochondrial splicing suppressor 51-like C-terminal domain-containing protein n=1 Tax=Cryomyces antarcticus TaxID=329879 RepID=A0ABR0M877_9PEZI|nr:hypothetical protein LTR39_001186 [Cryomyces antarcticus]KAK5019939.1 hypothetical protein LTR60_000972 [Cryomyces antarcticus]KAK5292263.1 hypothetical protein LTR16_001988 [Cryomyces antarcticus]
MTERMWLYLFLATEAMTIPLTILAGLEDVLPELPDAQSLSIHIVGAAGKEFANLMLFEELLHLLPSLIYLRVVTIGPRSPGESAGQTGGLSQEVSMACCSICESQGRRRTVTSYRGLYHDYARTSQYQKPDLAVLFHSGRSQAEGASWAPTTRFLVDSATATLCTTYTNREALEEVAELDHLGARMIVRPEVNRWKALPPLPDFLEREHTVYYHNFYRYIFQGKM